jgi:hypothetical protein
MKREEIFQGLEHLRRGFLLIGIVVILLMLVLFQFSNLLVTSIGHLSDHRLQKPKPPGSSQLTRHLLLAIRLFSGLVLRPLSSERVRRFPSPGATFFYLGRASATVSCPTASNFF